MLKRAWFQLIRVLLSCGLAGFAVAAQAGLSVYTNWVTLPPTNAANQRTVDFSTNTLASESPRLAYSQVVGDCNRYELLVPTTEIIGYVFGLPIYGIVLKPTYPCTLIPISTVGSITYTGSSSAAGFSGNALVLKSGINNNATSVSITFTTPTSYVGFLWGFQFKPDFVTDSDTQFVDITLENGSIVTLTNCRNGSSTKCLSGYVDSNWLAEAYNFFLGWLLGDIVESRSVYVQYQPDNGVRVKKIEFRTKECADCGAIGLDRLHTMAVDYLTYVDGAAPPHHLRLSTASATAAPNTDIPVTVTACGNADCTQPYINGVTGTLALSGLSGTWSPSANFSILAGPNNSATVNAKFTTTGKATLSLPTYSPTPSNTPKVFCGLGVVPAAGNSCELNVTQPLHHLRVQSVANGLTCTPNTYTITACANADCSTLHTAGVTGTLAISGSTVNYPAGSAFSIPTGSSSTTLQAQLTKALTYTVGLTGLSQPPISTPQVYCGMGATPVAGGSCQQTMADAGLLFDVPNHVAGENQTVTVSAIRKSDNSLSCTPAFASTSKTINFKCAYSNPSTGSVAAMVGGSALNASNNAANACDGGGRDISLNFNASGVASTTVSYADAGQVGLNASYTGSAAGKDEGLSMTGTDSFVAVPYDFEVSSAASPIKAGAPFSVSVRARNRAGATTRNFTAPIGLSFVRTQPSGTDAVTGAFTATLGSWSNGTTSATGTYGEVGRGDIVATLTSGSYLGTGKTVAGSSTGSWVDCAAENGTCTLPAGSTAIVAYGAQGRLNQLSGRTGSVACNNATFGDPIVGVVKRCAYMVTGGAHATVSGSVGPFIPNHFDVTVSQACPSGDFTYSDEPFSMTVTARNVSGGVTQNYDGTANTSPNFAKAVTVSAATNSGLGTLGTTSLSASAFSKGIGTLSTQKFIFTDKLTAPAAVKLRAVDADNVSSSGQIEGEAKVRSGRLKMFNAFGSEKAALDVPLQIHYWTGKAWVINGADNCTQIDTGSVVRARYLNNKGAATTAWSSSPAGPVTMVAGQAKLSMGAPSGGATGTVELAINLGNTNTDQSCLSQHPISTGLNKPWLRSVNGSCAATHDRDPSARATFGVYAPETQKAVHVRDVY